MNEQFLHIAPFGGINTRFPEHRIVDAKKGVQKVRQLHNLMSLDGRLNLIGGASRIDAVDKGGSATWQKRMYYQDGSGDFHKYSFAVLNNQMYKLNQSTATYNQVKISGSLSLQFANGFYPISTTIKSNATLATYLVDGVSMYKFLPNEDGVWEKLGTLLDVDGGVINPIFNAEWLDRQWVLVKGRNVVIGSKNRQPETFNDATDSVILQLPPGSGGFPRALIKYRGLLYIWHDDYFVPITGSTATTFGVRPGDTVEGYGTHAPRSVHIVKNQIGFLNGKDSEYYRTSGSFDSTEKVPLSYDIELRKKIDPVKVKDTLCHFDTILNCIRIAYYPTGGTTFGDEEIYSISEEKWCGQTRGRNISCYSQWDGLDDDGRLLTGRSDIGVVMWNDASLNFDSLPIHFKFVSAAYCPTDPFDFQMDEAYADLKPTGNTNIWFRSFMDARLTTVGENSINQEGEVINVGLITLAEQRIFMQRFVPQIDRSKGRMVRFEIEGTNLNQLFEMYGIYLFFSKQDTKFSSLVGGM